MEFFDFIIKLKGKAVITETGIIGAPLTPIDSRNENKNDVGIVAHGGNLQIILFNW